jgi:hypothetical protein
MKMKATSNIILCLFLTVCLLTALGCGKKADENKPISEVKTEAETMSTDDLRAAAISYKEAIMAKNAEVEKIAAKLKDIPVTEMLAEEAKGLKADMENLNKSVSALQERFKIYYDKLKEKGGDLSGLEI